MKHPKPSPVTKFARIEAIAPLLKAIQTVGGAVAASLTADLAAYEACLNQHKQRGNLMGPSAFGELWTRHFNDAIGLRVLRPHGHHWLDLGSGAGIPGIVLAASLKGVPNTRLDLVEAQARKADFLREVAARLGLSVNVHRIRIENLTPVDLPGNLTITARALAPMPRLWQLIKPMLASGKASALVIKGQNWRNELDAQTREEARITEENVEGVNARYLSIRWR